MPKDPVMLLSYVNTKLRDEFSSLSDLCKYENVSEDDISKKLNTINYFYDLNRNQFL